MRKIFLLLAVMAVIAGCSPVSSEKDVEMAVNGLLEIKVPCRSAQWDTVTTTGGGRNAAVVKAKILFMDGKFRIEIMDPGSERRQVILLDKKNLYVLGADNKAYMYGTDMREAEIFLRRIFVNTGTARKPEMMTGQAEYNGQKCLIYEYGILRSVNGLYAKAVVKEWRNKKGATVKMETEIKPAEFEAGGRKIVVGPIKETYETSNYKCGGRFMGMLFEVPMGMEIIDYREEYLKKMKTAGKETAEDASTAVFTIRLPEKK